MSALACPVCRRELAIAPGSVGAQDCACPHCRSSLEVVAFPALWRVAEIGRAGDPVVSEEAGCYVHADRRAEAACDRCGRFMCALCAVTVGAQRICVACLEARRPGFVDGNRTVFALLALRVALFGVLLGPFGPVAGTSALVLGIVGLVRKASITGRRHVGSAIASIVLGAAVTIGWSLVWIALLA